ncbi:DUF1707 domain-containing protein [Blastococcus brunescens]|uniref:DUF1707 domain-containing protein n=1 Tax=Blastococcus brunescens TaxID=1564165 RepID=A0ABZ1B7Q3_9ACTN|nr:DUF1707 domain-containing protein [Blastococcus sp. BMG 8361]WRL65903.1 DUF1707 domain-containing protein [Blastococcus sp. BMG 8361]
MPTMRAGDSCHSVPVPRATRTPQSSRTQACNAPRDSHGPRTPGGLEVPRNSTLRPLRGAPSNGPRIRRVASSLLIRLSLPDARIRTFGRNRTEESGAMTLSPHAGNGPLPMPLQPHGPRQLERASDADREAVVHVLHDAVARGMLTLAEGDERMTEAYRARYRDDLPPLITDLPPAPAPAMTAPGWRALTTLALLQVRTSLARIPGGGALRSRPGLAGVGIALLFVLLVLGILGMDEPFGLDFD